MITKMKTIAATTALAAIMTLGANAASAASCTLDGATITKIDATVFDPALAASACEEFSGNIDTNTVFIDGLNDGTFFAGFFDAGTTWTALGDSSFTADIDEDIGVWTADFGTTVMNNLVVALKGAQDSALFLWKDLFPAGTKFEGGFDMTKAGLISGKDGGADLSNFNVAGVFVGTPGVVPLPAAGWLLLMGIGGLGVASRRRRKAQHS